MTNLYNNIKERRKALNMSQQQLAEKAGYTDRSSIAKIESGKVDLTQSKIMSIATALNTSSAELLKDKSDLYGTDSQGTVTFAVIGDVAAGYDSVALEQWDGETVEIPACHLAGRRADDFFVLRVKGESMYPAYVDGDKVLVLRQSTLNRSGQVGVVIYNDELSTIKKIEYVQGENWMRLVPLNPNYPPIKIENEELEHCRILGIPKLIIREITE